jgi:hypothetical protein
MIKETMHLQLPPLLDFPFSHQGRKNPACVTFLFLLLSGFNCNGPMPIGFATEKGKGAQILFQTIIEQCGFLLLRN